MSDRDIQRSITAFWDTVAPGYDSPQNVAAAGSADYDRWRQALAQVLPSAPTRVLDVGTGTGFLAGIAAELGHCVTGIDLSAGMLDAARAADSAAGVTFLVGDAVAPAFVPASFDAVISRSVLWTLREPNRAMANWYQLLAPEGKVIAFYGLSPAEDSEPANAGDEPSLFERHYTAEARSELPAMHLSSHDPLLQAATDAGFERVSTMAIHSLQGWETSPGSDLPYALVAYRPAEP